MSGSPNNGINGIEMMPIRASHDVLEMIPGWASQYLLKQYNITNNFLKKTVTAKNSVQDICGTCVTSELKGKTYIYCLQLMYTRKSNRFKNADVFLIIDPSKIIHKFHVLDGVDTLPKNDNIVDENKIRYTLYDGKEVNSSAAPVTNRSAASTEPVQFPSRFGGASRRRNAKRHGKNRRTRHKTCHKTCRKPCRRTRRKTRRKTCRS